MSIRAPHDPRGEAGRAVEGRFEVRVLEPSPGGPYDDPYFAEDPVSGGEIVPIERDDGASWSALCLKEGDASLERFCTERWLGPWPALGELPDGLVAVRGDLHRLAQYVLAPLRHAANGKIGLRWTRGGFGTPFFLDAGGERQLRVEGPALVLESPNGPSDQAITTLSEAADFAGVSGAATTGVFEPNQAWEPDRALSVGEREVEALGAFFGFCTSVLEQLRAEASDAARVQLWPEHFDIALDAGDAAHDQRANYGGSPGDAEHPEPYLYVGPWSTQQGTFWNEPFGASFGYRALREAGDAQAQRECALAFFRRARRLLETGGESDQ